MTANLFEQLDGHQRTRRSGVPSVSLLVGRDDSHQTVWRAWLDRVMPARALCVLSASDMQQGSVAAHLLSTVDLLDAAVRRICDLTGEQLETIQRRRLPAADEETRLFWTHLEQRASDHKLFAVCRELLEFGDAETLCHDRHHDYLAVASPESLPAVLLQCPGDADIDDIRLACEHIADFAEHVPSLPVAIDVSRDLYERLFERHKLNRKLAQLRSGLVFLPQSPVMMPQVSNGLRASGESIEPDAQAAVEGKELTTRSQSESNKQTSEHETESRSSSEELLYNILQATTDLRDVFALNKKLDFAFGNSLGEGDFVSQKLRLVLEVDGYYHFQDFEAYRRDRRKDLAMQMHDWMVVRILAEDIAINTEAVLQSIRAAVAHRLQES